MRSLHSNCTFWYLLSKWFTPSIW